MAIQGLRLKLTGSQIREELLRRVQEKEQAIGRGQKGLTKLESEGVPEYEDEKLRSEETRRRENKRETLEWGITSKQQEIAALVFLMNAVEMGETYEITPKELAEQAGSCGCGPW